MCEVNITADECWFRFERTRINIAVIDVNGDPVTLSGALMWRLINDSGEILIEKTGIPVDGNIAHVDILEDDYALAIAGHHNHKLWDTTTHAVLASGKAVLLGAIQI